MSNSFYYYRDVQRQLQSPAFQATLRDLRKTVAASAGLEETFKAMNEVNQARISEMMAAFEPFRNPEFVAGIQATLRAAAVSSQTYSELFRQVRPGIAAMIQAQSEQLRLSDRSFEPALDDLEETVSAIIESEDFDDTAAQEFVAEATRDPKWAIFLSQIMDALEKNPYFTRRNANRAVFAIMWLVVMSGIFGMNLIPGGGAITALKPGFDATTLASKAANRIVRPETDEDDEAVP